MRWASCHPPSITRGARSRSSTLEDRLRYTPSTVFASFPWPYPISAEQREEIGTISTSIIKRRQEICAAGAIGLTTLYNQVDEGAYADLKALHRKLDEAVAEAYGWPKAAAHDSDAIVHQLLELNREIAAGKRRYDPFGTRASAMDELPMQDLSVECRPRRPPRARLDANPMRARPMPRTAHRFPSAPPDPRQRTRVQWLIRTRRSACPVLSVAASRLIERS